MSDKDSSKTMPHVRISVQIGITPMDILPLLQKALTGEEIPQNDTETTHKNPTRRTPHEIQ